MIVLTLVLVLFVTLLLLFVYAVRFMVQSFDRGRLYALSTASQSDSVGGVGISIIVVSPANIDVVVSLLGSRYPLSEVVVAIDEKSHNNLLSQLRLRYSLTPCSINKYKVYRSVDRAFRRLVVVAVDGVEKGQCLADMAAENALFDYMLFVPSSCRLFDLSVGRIADAVAAVGGVDIVTTSERGVELISRAEWRRRGGFAANVATEWQRRVVHISEPLAFGEMTEKEHSVTIERSRYNFLDYLALNIMRYRNKLLSLISRADKDCFL